MNLKKIKNLSSVFLGFFAITDIINFIDFIIRAINNPKSYPIMDIVTQGIYVLGIISILIFYVTLIKNIEKEGVFAQRNKRIILCFGCILVACGLVSALFANWFTDISDSGPRMLGVIGSTLIFFSFIFNTGIKLKEEQELTI